MTQQSTINWQALVAELNGFGLSQAKIGSHCGATQGTISSLATGETKEPKFGLGTALQQLHAREKRKQAQRDRRAQLRGPSSASSPAPAA